jgi:hypothetical protein
LNAFGPVLLLVLEQNGLRDFEVLASNIVHSLGLEFFLQLGVGFLRRLILLRHPHLHLFVFLPGKMDGDFFILEQVLAQKQIILGVPEEPLCLVKVLLKILANLLEKVLCPAVDNISEPLVLNLIAVIDHQHAGLSVNLESHQSFLIGLLFNLL